MRIGRGSLVPKLLIRHIYNPTHQTGDEMSQLGLQTSKDSMPSQLNLRIACSIISFSPEVAFLDPAIDFYLIQIVL